MGVVGRLRCLHPSTSISISTSTPPTAARSAAGRLLPQSPRIWKQTLASQRIQAAGATRCFSLSAAARQEEKDHSDARISDLGREIADEYAAIKDHYDAPKYPIVLAHGLLGFSELRLAKGLLPPIYYWHGITTALRAQGAEVITASVPPSGSIEQRAAKLGADIAAQAHGRGVNIIAHSMGGLDARCMISRLRPAGVEVRSLVTVATPHRGSAFADYLMGELLGPALLPGATEAFRRATGFADTGAFAQLTQRYMADEFNPATPDDPNVRYFSYGARLVRPPPLLSPFRLTHSVLSQREGPNDGLVSVASSRWGDYKGTLVGVSHLDLINWTNKLRWTVRTWMGQKKTFNAVALYLDIADMLAKEGL